MCGCNLVTPRLVGGAHVAAPADVGGDAAGFVPGEQPDCFTRQAVPSVLAITGRPVTLCYPPHNRRFERQRAMLPKSVIYCLAATAFVATTALMPTGASAARGNVPQPGTWNWPPPNYLRLRVGKSLSL
jgi:hypothetical protein